ncbi:hypothetical protein [Nitrospira japonica]|nr:hypothetical protein [Nitrospira japonica]
MGTLSVNGQAQQEMLRAAVSFIEDGLVDPRIRASNEHCFIARIPRAGG